MINPFRLPAPKSWAVSLLLFLCSVTLAQAGYQRPSVDGGPTQVEAMAFILDLDEINSADQAFAANIFYMARWKDPAQAHAGETTLKKPLASLWHPSLQIINQQRLWRTFPEEVEITPEGVVTYRQRVWGYFSQPMQLVEFPFDRQTFTVQFAAAGLKPSEIDFALTGSNRSGIAEELSVADWAVVDSHAEPHNYHPLEQFPEVPGFVLRFTAERETGYYVIKVIIPLVLIVMMSWVVFWIDPSEAGSQIGVAMTAMLTLIAYRFAVGTLLPKVSYLTRMDWFILLSTLLVFASMVEVVITSALAKRNRLRLARSIDYIARGLFPLAFLLTAQQSFF